MQDVEILVHTSAPSRGPDDARYRALAQAYLRFVPTRRQPLEIDDKVVSSNVVRQRERNTQEYQKQTQTEPESWESYRPPADDEDQDHVDEQDVTKSTQETTQGRFTYLQSFGSEQLSFGSVDDNVDSPFYQTRLTKKKVAKELTQLFQSPTKSIPDSQPQVEEGHGNEQGFYSSPTKVLELYLQKIDSSQDCSEGYGRQRLEDPEVTPTRPATNNAYPSYSFGSSPPINISRALFRPRAPSPILGDPTPSPTSNEKNTVSSPSSQPTSSGSRQPQELVSDPASDMNVTSSTPSGNSNGWVTWSPTERLRARQPVIAKEVSVAERNNFERLCESSRAVNDEVLAHVSMGKLLEDDRATALRSSDINRTRILETVPRKTIPESLLKEKGVPSASRLTSRLQVEEFATPILARKHRDMTRKALWNTPVTTGPRIEETQLSVLRQPHATIHTSYSSPDDRIPETPYPGFQSAHFSRRKLLKMDSGNEQALSAISSDKPEEYVHPSKRPRTNSAKESVTAGEGDSLSSSADSTRETKRPRGIASIKKAMLPVGNESPPMIPLTQRSLMEAEPGLAATLGARDLRKDKATMPSISDPAVPSSSDAICFETSIALSSNPSSSQQLTTPIEKKMVADSAPAIELETSEQPRKKLLSFTGLPDEPEPTSSMPNIFQDDEEEVVPSSDQPPSSSPVIPQVDHLLRIRPTPVMDSYLAVDWLSPPHPPTGTAPIDPETFITPMFHEIVKKFPIDYLYHPATQTREIEPLGRGYWRVDCSSWDQAVKQKTWNTIGNLIAPGLLGWGVSCSRWSFENEGEKISNGWDVFRCHCWGIQVPYVYCMLFMASQNKIARVKAEWMVIRTNIVVTMPIKEKKT